MRKKVTAPVRATAMRKERVIVIIMASCRVTREVTATPLAICMAMGKA